MIFECHGHIIADGVRYADSMQRHINGVDMNYVRRTLETIAACGIAYYRDGGDKFGVSAYAKQIAPEYGIEYRTPAFILHRMGYYGSMYGRSFEGVREYRALVRQAIGLGADFVKTTVTGMLNFKGKGEIQGPVVNTEELKEMVHIAGEEGLRVMAHVNGADNVKRALEAGTASIEHGFWPDRSVIDCFLQTDAVWVPTCSAAYNLIGGGRYDDSVVRMVFEAQKSVLIEAYGRGVRIASGSDCGAWNVPQGRGTVDEVSRLREMGIDPQKGNLAIRDRFVRR